jgi:hypothetical protein
MFRSTHVRSQVPERTFLTILDWINRHGRPGLHVPSAEEALGVAAIGEHLQRDRDSAR